MGALKTAFLNWKRKAYPNIHLNGDQVLYMNNYFNGVESASPEQLPTFEGIVQIQDLISEFWHENQERLIDD